MEALFWTRPATFLALAMTTTTLAGPKYTKWFSSWHELGETDQKKSGLKVVTLIATPNPVSQVLW
jgi:hypothetical protein